MRRGSARAVGFLSSPTQFSRVQLLFLWGSRCAETALSQRIDLVKAALLLTPDQQKYWPAIENAIRARAEDRKAREDRSRLAKIVETVGKRADESSVEVFRNRDPIAFLQRRSAALAQRSADLDKLAEAWQPLYKTLSPEQRQRMAALAIFVLHDMSDVVERRRAQSEDEYWAGLQP